MSKNKEHGPISSLAEPVETATKATVESMETDTLAGDIRDAILPHFRSIKVPWAMLSEDEQMEKINAIEKLGREVARRVVFLVAASDIPCVHVQLGKWSVGDQIEAKVTASGIVANIQKLAEHGQNAALLVLADPGAYMGERERARPDKDQPDLPLDPSTNG